MLNKLIDQMKDDKYKAISSNLEFLLECGVEYSDHAQMLKDAIEYIDLLEGVIMKIDSVMEGMADKMAEANEKRNQEISQLVFRWELLRVRANKVDLESVKGPAYHYNLGTQMRIIEKTLADKYNYYIDVEEI
jgi:hypothetical protein